MVWAILRTLFPGSQPGNSVDSVKRLGGLWIGAVWLTSSLVACGGQTTAAPGELTVKLEDFRLHLTTDAAASGIVKMLLNNDGPSTHEFNVDRTDLPADDLPLRTDGLSVEEKDPRLTRIGSVEVLEAGDRVHFKIKLVPGHYVLYCNLEGHYLGKMYATLDVH